jgi:hypothetical protein
MGRAIVNKHIVDCLLVSNEPAIRYKLLVNMQGTDPGSPEAIAIRKQIVDSPVVKALLSERGPVGEIPYHPYTKWVGAHWVLACLADLDYPVGDEGLRPLFEQEYGWLLSNHHYRSIKTIDGRVRRCASQEGNALYSSCALGFLDDRSEELAVRLLRWQWADGGWNCDKKPGAVNSSFMESLIPLRGLAIYARLTGDPAVSLAAENAAEIFLKRELYKRQKDGGVISDNFLRLHYPCYWHYDILFGLKVMSEAGFIKDPRCNAALDLLESKRLPDGGFPAEDRYYRLTDRPISGRSRVNWGCTSVHRMNEFVTADALYVLKAAGRISVGSLPKA